MNGVFTKASEIAAYINERLALITVANGYNTDIGLRVFRGKRSKVEEHIPCSVLIEGEDHPGEDAHGRGQLRLSQDYVCGGYVVCDPDNPNDAAHLVLQDLKLALFGPHDPPAGRPLIGAGPHNFGGRVQTVAYRGRDIGARADGEASVFAVVHIRVAYAETLSDP